MSELDLSKKQLPTKLKITNLNGEPIVIDPKKWLSISDNQLDYDIQNMAVRTYSIERAKDVAGVDMQNAEAAVNSVWGKLYNAFIDDKGLREKNHGRKPTDAMLRAKIDSIPQYTQLVNQYHHRNYVFQVLKDLSYAMQMKSNLLQTESSNLRARNRIRDNNDY